MSAERATGRPTTADAGAVSCTAMSEETVRPTVVFAAVACAAVPVMRSVNTPVGVAFCPDVVVTVMVLVHDVPPVLHDGDVNEADALVGRPDAANVMPVSVPALLVRVAVMTRVLFTIDPCTTATGVLGDAARVNVRGGVAVMFRGNVVVLPKGPLSMTVMVRGEAVTCADEDTVRVSVCSQEEPTVVGGVQDAGVKDAVTP